PRSTRFPYTTLFRSEALGLDPVDDLQPVPEVRDAEQVARPRGLEHRPVARVQHQDERRQDDLRHADGDVERRRAACRHGAERDEPVDEQDDADEEQADVAHHRLTSSTNVSVEITGAKKLVIRSNAAGSWSGRCAPVASPRTIGSRPWSRAARA